MWHCNSEYLCGGRASQHNILVADVCCVFWDARDYHESCGTTKVCGNVLGGGTTALDEVYIMLVLESGNRATQ